jgi:hypothetical protein
MLKNNIYNIDREFDYPTVKAIVLKSLVKIAKEDALKKKSNVPNNVVFHYDSVYDNPNNMSQATRPSPLLKLKIRNTTKSIQY